MPSTFTVNKGIEQPAAGSYNDTWSTPVNADWEDIDNAFGGNTQIIVTGVAAGIYTLSLAQYQPPNIVFSGTITASQTYVVPPGVGGIWTLYNNTTGAFAISFGVSGGTPVTIASGTRQIVVCDGTNTQFAQTATASAPPGALVGLTAVPGTSGGTYMPSNAAPALDQSITPTWTGAHIFDNTVALEAAVGIYNTATVHTGGEIDGRSGTVLVPTATVGDNTNNAASTAFVATSFATKVSPTLSGTPVTPTASPGTNTSQIASTAFVQAALAAAGAFSAGNPGYIEFANGIIIQWGVSVFTSGGSAVNFPIAFPTGALMGIANTFGGAATSYCVSVSTTQITAVNGAGTQSSWIAIGH